jgi:hypothetical protein
MGQYDIPYAMQGVKPDYVNHIARLSIVWPLVIKKGMAPNWNHSFKDLLALWRKRASSLKAAGWSTYHHPMHLRNCFPAMFILKDDYQKVRYCRLGNICPYCYAREIAPISSGVFEYCKSGNTLVAATHSIFIPVASAQASWLRTCFEEKAEELRRLGKANAAAADAFFWMVTADPIKKKDEECQVRISSRTLVLVKPSCKLYLIPKGWRVNSYLSPDAQTIHGAIATVVRYPTGLLKGPADPTLEILNARRGLRLSECSGKFRKVRICLKD